ncbi:MAG: transglycosylase domain-containing protein [Lewinellaceae bacterium]|nr:transglycosylase domain-containing protein [Phaeodactylibacter sp.]MCB9040483.1 transglycosylase domain-containing protein [Lewinellaceae bacterium]
MRERIRSFLEPALQRWRSFAQNWPRLSRVVKWGGIAGCAGLATLLLAWAAVLLTVPTVRELRQVQAQIASDIYTSDSLLLGRYYNEYRTVVPVEEIPQHVLDALVATEDERFFQHQGIDYRSWARVLVKTILQGDEGSGGGSTISQQLAKNLFPRRDYLVFPLVVNKVREIAIARRLERAYSKQELLGLYLNTVPFPENVFGIDVAARRFFNKPPVELLVEEGAALVGALRATTYYNPARYPERARERRNVVLGQMVRNGYIEPAAGDSIQALPLALNYNPVVRNEDIAPYFLAHVRKELEKLLADIRKPNGEPYNLYTDGLKVYTSLNSEMQRIAEAAVAEHLTEMQGRFDEHWQGRTAPWMDVRTVERAMKQSRRYRLLSEKGLTEEQIRQAFEQPDSMTVFSWSGPRKVWMTPLDSLRHQLGLLQVGFIALEPYTGYVRAWVGGIDFGFFQYDHVTAHRQAGSVFKPVVYTQALRSGVEPCEQIPNELVVYHEYAAGDWAVKDWRRDDPEPHFTPEGKDEDDWIPQNADGIYGGSYSLEGALVNSVNTVSVKLVMQMGVAPVMELAREMGVTSEIPAEPSIALGTAEVSLYDMSSVFATLASQGRQVRPQVIHRIETHDGQVLAELGSTPPRQVVDSTRAAMMTRMLESVATVGTASRLRWRYGLYNVPLAGKTGTSQNHADGWFIGYTPKLVVGAWVGGDSPLVRFRNFEYGQGAATALPVCALFLRQALKEPGLEKWQGGEFHKLPPEELRRLSCPLRIKSPEELLRDSLMADSLFRDSLLLADSLLLDTPALEPE